MMMSVSLPASFGQPVAAPGHDSHGVAAVPVGAGVGAAFGGAGDLAAILTKLEPGDVLFVDEAVLPRRLHVPGDKDLDVEFTPSGRNVTLHVQYGVDHLWISFLVSQGGRWISS